MKPKDKLSGKDFAGVGKDYNKIVDPSVCRDKGDFYKFVFAFIEMFVGDRESEVREYAAETLRLILHEYLALVLSGELPPYVAATNPSEDTIKGFEELMHEVTMSLAEIGVPFKEGENGKIDIDFSQVKGGNKNGKDNK